jgi:hypothetical protein
MGVRSLLLYDCTLFQHANVCLSHFPFIYFLDAPPRDGLKKSTSGEKSNQIKSNQIKSNQIKSNQIKSNQIKSNQIKSNQM